jgi:sugar phosphate isomerase/epimerase
MTATPRIACSESLLGDDLPGAWDLIRRAGVCGIEVVDSPQGLARRLEALKRAQRSGVVISTLCMQPPFLGQHEPGTIQLGLRAAKLAVSSAGELGVAGLVMPLGVPPGKTRDGAATQRYLVQALIELAEHAASAGVVLLLEPLNRYEEAHVNRLAQAAALCDEVASHSIGIVADFFHMNIEESEPVDALRTFVGYTKHVHVADSNRLQPGAGHLNIQALVGVLGRSDYSGWLTLECEVRDPLESALREAVCLLTSAWTESRKGTSPTSLAPVTTASQLG